MYYEKSSCWLIFLTIYSPISFSLSSQVTSSWYISIHDCVPTRTEIVEVRLSQRSVFALTYWKLIVMELIAKNSPWVVHNFWESDKEQAQTHKCVCVCCQIKDVPRTCTTEICSFHTKWNLHPATLGELALTTWYFRLRYWIIDVALLWYASSTLQ